MPARVDAASTGRKHAGVTYEFEAELWQWDARQADTWTFVALPTEIADEILELSAPFARGFGSVRVEVTVWRTSIFPDSKRGTYVLPVKKAVRAAERLATGDAVRVRLGLVEV